MPTSPDTSDTLIAKLGDPLDRESWEEFVSVYRPLIFRIAHQHRLQHADAENLMQDVLAKVNRQTSQWESEERTGSFRGWLASVARNAAVDAIRRIRPDAARGGTSVRALLAELPDPAALPENLFRRELEREAFRWAARRIRHEFADETWTAFWETMVEGAACADVADRLGKRVGAIYTARSRVIRRLREEIDRFDWKDDANDFLPAEERS